MLSSSEGQTGPSERWQFRASNRRASATKSGWSIVEISNNGHTRNFAHNENTFCSMSYHNLVEIKSCVLM